MCSANNIPATDLAKKGIDPVTKQGIVPPADKSERWARVAGSLIFLLAFAYTIWSAREMSGGMRMPGGWTMPMMWMGMPGRSTIASSLSFLLMWQAMMIAMMLPSSWPMLELYGRVARHTGQRHPLLNTAVVGTGYFAAWGIFGAIAFAIGFKLSQTAMASPNLSRAIPAAAGVALVLAGIWQVTPLKQTCLHHCRDPLLFLGHAYKPGTWPAFRVGLHHGAFCAACCWALMLMQLVLGVMNLAVMALIAAIIATEKLWSCGPIVARIVGAASIAVGLAFLVLTVHAI